MNHQESKIFIFIERSLAEGKKADADGYYIYTKNELSKGTRITPSSISKHMPQVIESLLSEEKGWLPGSDEPINMLSDISYTKDVLKFRRNPYALSPELDYYWAPYPTYSFFHKKEYDDKHRRRTNSTIEICGTFPWSWDEEQVANAYNMWMSSVRIKDTYSYVESDEMNPEQERILSIRINGGTHLKNFKPENITYEMCLVAVQMDGWALQFVPEEYKTKEIYEIAANKTGKTLSIIPPKYIKKKMCKSAVISDGLALEYVPDKFKNSDVCLAAAIQNPLAMHKMPEELITVSFVVNVAKKCSSGIGAISFLPKSLKNADFYLSLVEAYPEVIWALPDDYHTAAISKACLKSMKCKTLVEAVKKNPEFLSQVHTSLYDYESCKAFVNSDFFVNEARKNSGFNSDTDCKKGLYYVNDKFRRRYSIPHMAKWPDICLKLISVNCNFIRYVKPTILTAEMCSCAVEACPNGFVLDDIPMEFRTKELCMLAFSKSPYTIQYFPDEYITQELVIQAVRQSGYILGHISDKYKTKEVCLIAVSDEGKGKLEEIPEDIIDREICLAWINNLKTAICPLDYIPDRFKDYEICYACISKDGSDIQNVPSEYIDDPMCLAAVKNESSAAKFIPPELFTAEMAEIMTERSHWNFEDIPKHLLTEKMCINALEKSEFSSNRILAEIPEELITQEMCDIAVGQHVWGLESVPEKFVTEDMLISVAKKACGVLTRNFPERFRTKEFIEKLISIEPGCKWYLNKYLSE